METRFLVVAIFSLFLVSCGKSDEGPHKRGLGNDVSDTLVAMESDAPATAESI